jgi:hypothetical protein
MSDTKFKKLDFYLYNYISINNKNLLSGKYNKKYFFLLYLYKILFMFVLSKLNKHKNTCINIKFCFIFEILLEVQTFSHFGAAFYKRF